MSDELADLPELDDAERRAADSLPADAVDHWFAGEIALFNPDGTFKEWVPATDENLERAFEEAPTAPISDEEIARMVEYATTTCPNCEGSGRRPLPRGMSSGFYAFMVPGCRDQWPPRMLCPVCEGTGKVKPAADPGP